MKKSKVKVSVIVPVYNTYSIDGGKSLRTCINSVLNQSYKDLQIILIDNDSTDESSRVLKEFTKKDKRIQVLKEKKKGVSNARNLGLEKVTGKYICFVDSDDRIRSEFIERLVEEAEKNKSDIVVNHVTYHDNRVSPLEHFLNQEYGLEKLRLYIRGVNGNLYRQSFLDKNKIRFDPSVHIAEDFLFNLVANDKTKAVTFLKYRGYRYNYHESSAINTKSDNYLDHFKSFNFLLKTSDKSLYKFFARLILTDFLYMKKYILNKKEFKRREKEFVKKWKFEKYNRTFTLNRRIKIIKRYAPLFLIWFLFLQFGNLLIQIGGSTICSVYLFLRFKRKFLKKRSKETKGFREYLNTRARNEGE